MGGPNYPTRFAEKGPRHVIGTLYLGSLIDPYELDGAPSTNAKGDDYSGVDDEDGVAPTFGVNWKQGAAGGSVDVTVTGGPGCLSGWIDWTGDGDLVDGAENILSNVGVTTGTSTHIFYVPVDPSSGTFYARFRLYAQDVDGCTSPKEPTGPAVNGEVEDYVWSFTPTAVSLSAFSGTRAPAALPVVSGILAVVSAAYFALRRTLRG